MLARRSRWKWWEVERPQKIVPRCIGHPRSWTESILYTAQSSEAERETHGRERHREGAEAWVRVNRESAFSYIDPFASVMCYGKQMLIRISSTTGPGLVVIGIVCAVKLSKMTNPFVLVPTQTV